MIERTEVITGGASAIYGSDALARGELLGFNASPHVSGSFDVYDLFGELYLSVFSDVQFAELFAIELAVRYSKYSTIGGVTAYKIGREWAPTQSVRFIIPLFVHQMSMSFFGPRLNGYPTVVDPCNRDSGIDADVRALCKKTGASSGYKQFNPQIEIFYVGNLDLQEEKAKTLTFGAVFEPSFINNLSFSIDYWKIDIDNYITDFGGGMQNIFNGCYNKMNNADLSPDNIYCKTLNRGANGLPRALLEKSNSASLKTSGIDFSLDYKWENFFKVSLPGHFGLKFVGIYLNKYDYLASTVSSVNKCAGTFGELCNNSTPQPKWKHNLNLSWANNNYNVLLRWRYDHSVKDDDNNTKYTIEKIKAYNYFNLSGRWIVNDIFSFNLGIRNLLDQKSPIIGDNDKQANTHPSAYDSFGRTFFIGVKAKL